MVGPRELYLFGIEEELYWNGYSSTYEAYRETPPGGCQLARVRSEQDLTLIRQALMEKHPGIQSARIGVFKDPVSIAEESKAGASLDVRRSGWINLDGSEVPPSVWAEGAPMGFVGNDANTLAFEAIYVMDMGLTDQFNVTHPFPFPPAVYECCPSVGCNDFLFLS